MTGDKNKEMNLKEALDWLRRGWMVTNYLMIQEGSVLASHDHPAVRLFTKGLARSLSSFVTVVLSGQGRILCARPHDYTVPYRLSTETKWYLVEDSDGTQAAQ